MVFFVPKDSNLADKIQINALHELKTNEKGKVADYNHVGGVVSLFTKKNSNKIIKKNRKRSS